MNRFSRSFQEFKKLRTILVCAMLISLNLIIDRFSIQITTELRLTLSFLTNAMAGALFGPFPAMLCAGASDVLAAVLFPRGAFFPGFTVSALIGGLIYGFMLYEREITILRAVVAKGLINLFVNIGLNTLWISMMYGNAFFVIVSTRAAKNAILWIPEALIMFGVIVMTKKASQSVGLRAG